MAIRPLQVRVDDDVRSWLQGRAARMHTGSPDLQIRTELQMWRSVLASELRRIRLTLGQACCLADILNGVLLDATLGKVVWMEVADAFAIARDTPVPELSSYATKWGVDEDALLSWLSGLSVAADHALRDALVQWWDLQADSTVEGFARVGLTVIADGTTEDGPTP